MDRGKGASSGRTAVRRQDYEIGGDLATPRACGGLWPTEASQALLAHECAAFSRPYPFLGRARRRPSSCRATRARDRFVDAESFWGRASSPAGDQDPMIRPRLPGRRVIRHGRRSSRVAAADARPPTGAQGSAKIGKAERQGWRMHSTVGARVARRFWCCCVVLWSPIALGSGPSLGRASTTSRTSRIAVFRCALRRRSRRRPCLHARDPHGDAHVSRSRGAG